MGSRLVVVVVKKMNFLACCCHSDEEMEEANPIEANDSDYDPNKETKKEVRGHTWTVSLTCSHKQEIHAVELIRGKNTKQHPLQKCTY